MRVDGRERGLWGAVLERLSAGDDPTRGPEAPEVVGFPASSCREVSLHMAPSRPRAVRPVYLRVFRGPRGRRYWRGEAYRQATAEDAREAVHRARLGILPGGVIPFKKGDQAVRVVRVSGRFGPHGAVDAEIKGA